MYSPLKRLDCKLLLDGNNVQSSQVSLDQLLLDGNYCQSGTDTQWIGMLVMGKSSLRFTVGIEPTASLKRVLIAEV
jgi:hypothetical protein